MTLSERLYPSARIIFLFVSIRQFIPFSILSIVNGDTPAFLANSALLIRSSSLIFFTIFGPNLSSRLSGLPRCKNHVFGPLFYIYDIICQVFSYKLTKFYIICVYKGCCNKKCYHILCGLFLFPFVVVRPFASDIYMDFCKIYAQVGESGRLNRLRRNKKFFTNGHVQD